ncbi:MAG: hypothetical protein ACO3RB_00585 [Ilumatobacteraceae bacterium]|jgi:hypothetical protein
MGSFHAVAGTGRMGTSYIAESLDTLPGIAALHEGHRRNDDGADVLPMVNLQHLAAYRNVDAADRVVAELRSGQVVEAAAQATDSDVLIDVAYYNAVLARALLDHHSGLKLVALIRDCESFVRSATWIEGTDPMPVGWPDPDKSLDAREKFISLGRIRPLAGDDKAQWSSWRAIQRNIWLWRETNSVMLSAMAGRRERCLLLNFGRFAADSRAAMRRIAEWLAPEALTRADNVGEWPLSEGSQPRRNARQGTYQVGPSCEWTAEEREMLRSAENDIETLLEVCGGFD